MDIVKRLTNGINIKKLLGDEELLSLKEENLKPLRKTFQLEERLHDKYGKKDATNREENEKKEQIRKECEKRSFEEYYKDQELIKQYMKVTEINVESKHVNRRIVPLRYFKDIPNWLYHLKKEDLDKSNETEKLDQIRYDYKKLLHTLKHTMKYEKPTSIQKICIPAILYGLHTICISQTGSGKTCAFLIPLFIKLNEMKKRSNNNNNNNNHSEQTDPKNKEEKEKKKNGKKKKEPMLYIKSLILIPTNELGNQILQQGKMIAGAFSDITIRQLNPNISKEEEQDINICISTPLLLINLIKNKMISVKKCSFLMVDEVDRLFEENMREQINFLLTNFQNQKIQKVFTTATMPGSVQNFINTICTNYVIVYWGKNINTINSNVIQELLFVHNEEEKLIVLIDLIRNNRINIPALIFVDHIGKAKNLYSSLLPYVSNINIITSEQSKEERTKIVEELRRGTIWYLLCTNIMSRGLDVHSIETVINYDVCYDKYDYMHRIGRACRSERKEGKALTLFTKDNIKYMKDIVKFVQMSGVTIPDYLKNYKFVKFFKNKKGEKKENKKKKYEQIKKEKNISKQKKVNTQQKQVKEHKVTKNKKIHVKKSIKKKESRTKMKCKTDNDREKKIHS